MDHTHRLYKQSTRHPLVSMCGLLTSRSDDEWNETETSSHDLTFRGALPLVLGQEVESYCKMALSKLEGTDHKICTQQCKALKKQWKVIESYGRAKAIILQKAISAQLQLYKQKLKAKHVQQQQVDEMRGNSIEDEKSMNDDPICIPVPIVKSIAKKDQIMTLKA